MILIFLLNFFFLVRYIIYNQTYHLQLSVERLFSAMKIVNNRLCSRISDQ